MGYNTIMKKILSILLLGVFVLGLVTGCQQVPLTGRNRLLIVSDADMLALGQQQYQEVLAQSTLSRDPIKTQEVTRVGNRLAAAVVDLAKANGLSEYIQGYSWQFSLIQDDKSLNAFCLPGGKIAVYTGILPITKNDTGLAVVLSHEIAHEVAKHGAERLSQLIVLQYGNVTLAQAMKNEPTKTQAIINQVYGLGANVGVLLPYSRVQETEADRIGLIIMAKAGYDPREALKFWERMKIAQPNNIPEFLSTHPASDERIKDIQAEMPEALGYYKH
jgi:predicted Zn-dependent protease